MLILLLLVACTGVSAEAQATTMAMAVELTLQAAHRETLTAQPTEALVVTTEAAETASSTPEPTATNLPTATYTVTPYPIPDWPLLRHGDSGPEVFAIQHLLRFHGYDVTVDGQFGPQTRVRVIAFQNAKNLGADGIVGPQTWQALIQGASSDQGDTGQAVRALQRLLNKFGYNLNVDAAFGPATRSALVSFQSSYGLTADGVAGPDTWKALVAIVP
ncbi:MAG: peptidoglycan-binding protein [Anaerolineales bacterium]|nr:peptidoglycan-binding protein [Anaerolineales bacterium]